MTDSVDTASAAASEPDLPLPQERRRLREAAELTRQLPPPADVEVNDGADHFFTDQVEQLSATVVRFVTGD